MTDKIQNKYLIFDMDGTLIDSNRYLDTITTKFFEKRGISYTEEFLKATMTMSRTTFCTQVKELTGDPGTLEEIADEIDGYMMDIYRSYVHLLPDVETLLKKYQAAGKKMCIASATDAKTVRFVLNRLGILNYFEFICSCDDIGKDKDQPDVFLEAAKRLDAASPEEATVFEDSPLAIKTAKAAGFQLVGIYDPEDAAADTIKNICDLAVSAFSELL